MLIRFLNILKNTFKKANNIEIYSKLDSLDPSRSSSESRADDYREMIGKIICNDQNQLNILEKSTQFNREDYLAIRDQSPYIFDQYLRDKTGLNKFLNANSSRQALIIRVLENLNISESNPLRVLWLLNKNLERDSKIIDKQHAKEQLISSLLERTPLIYDCLETAPKFNRDYSKDIFKFFESDYGLIKRVSEDKWLIRIPESVQMAKINGKNYKVGEEISIQLGDSYFFNSKSDKKNYVFQLVRSMDKIEEFTMLKIAEGKSALAFNKLFPNGINQSYLEQQNIGSCLKLAAMINHLVLDETGRGLEHIFKYLSYDRVAHTGEIIFKYADNERLSKALLISPEDLEMDTNNLKLKHYQMEKKKESFHLYNKSENFIPVQGDLGFQVLERFMIDAIKQEKLFLPPLKKQSDFIALNSNPEDLERDQSNRVLRIFFPYLSIQEFSPDSFLFEEKVYKSIASPQISFNLGSKSPKELKHRSLIPNHAYAAEKIYLNPEGEMVFKIYNPHHFNAANKEKCVIYLSKEEVAENFERAIVFEVKKKQDF